MTILQSLASYYDRMAARGEAEPPGFSREKISFAVVIDRDGEPVAVSDLRDTTGKKPVATLRDVPASFKRPGVGVSPFFLWDTSAYVLGVDSKGDPRTAVKLAAFRDRHVGLLASTEDEGLLALRTFLERWVTERFAEAPFTADMLDTNIVFRLDGDVDDKGNPRLIHERPAASPLIEALLGSGEDGLCLITGTVGPMARLHPTTKGVYSDSPPPGGGHSLVSFNARAFESWGREQGANAPTGEAAAARYGAALNRLLDRGSRNRMRIGDATVAFWADTDGIEEAIAQAAEAALADIFGTGPKVDPDQDLSEARKVREALAIVAAGRPTTLNDVAIIPGTIVHVLGLSPNVARLSVRFWLTKTLGHLAANLIKHEQDCRVEPLPWKAPPSINWLLTNSVAARQDGKNIPPLLAGEVARAVLAGTPYPRTLLTNAIMRLRAGDDPATGWHAAVVRAVLTRSYGGAPMGLSTTEENAGYRLGRLFAVLEEAQERALGRVNASIRDRYFGAASATPASVFPLLLRGVQNHLGKLRKDEPGSAQSVEIKLGEIMSGIATDLPKTLKLEDQGRFAIGYYHQRSERFRKKGEAAADAAGNEGTQDQ
ncbi:type I-C CRISPR-associated protein Cas8c/Csd1 [Sphingomonas sp. 3-13AW]|uniref:type I-C CRISPR-associated protein Cas8c/Csd1 n=1 Tax=Sphingomonas sp. 3-13AW TaxID=3050450 RepID=UPI003BB51514